MAEDEQAILNAAADAHRLREDPVFQRTIRAAEERLIAEWKRSKPDEAQRREALYWSYRGLLELVRELRIAEDQGTMIARRHAEQEKLQHERARPAT